MYDFLISHQTFCEVFSIQTRSTVKHICEAEHYTGQSQYRGLAKQSYSRLIVATVEQSSGAMQGLWSLASGIYRIKVFIPMH